MKTPRFAPIFRSLFFVLLAIPLLNQTSLASLSRVSVASDGTEANSASNHAAVSADGSAVAFQSAASNLVSNDTNQQGDVFVHDISTGATSRVSIATDGTLGNAGSDWPVLSANGRYVAFSSFASNLVPGDNNFAQDIFLRDRVSGTTSRVSVASDGSEGNAQSALPSISSSGRLIVFYSAATNLVPNDTNGQQDVFLRDRQTGLTTRVSIASDGSEGNGSSDHPVISANGRYVAFASVATNLAPGDTNGFSDVFVRDLKTGETTLVSVATDGALGNNDSSKAYAPAISADGRYVAFNSLATNLVPNDNNGVYNVFPHDRKTGPTRRVSVSSGGIEGNGISLLGAISGSGQEVAFHSFATNLVSNDTNGFADVFVHYTNGQTLRLSLTNEGNQALGQSYNPRLSADGVSVAFESFADNLVENDTNGTEDIFFIGP